MKKVGIFGGTFDPPHYGHLLMANEVLTSLNLSEIWFMPNHIPPHKQKEQVTDSGDRVKMLELAIDDHPQFKIQTIELEREGPSYTYETIRQLKRIYKNYDFYFIIGADMVEYLPNWYKINELVKLVTFVGVKRPGFSVKTSYPLVEVEVPQFAVSSSLIRERVKKGKSIKYLVPEKVKLYIEEKRLYGTS
jgi:nicotinate-nucleotide adenylyltransferase